MVFGIFSRKPAPPAPEHKPIDPNPHNYRQPPQQQLRTPSPSVASVGNPNASPAFSANGISNSNLSPKGLNDDITPPPPPAPDSLALQALLNIIPPKVLHEYILNQLQDKTSPHSSDSLTISVLTSFFSALTPPPLLHCARCHKGFFDVENDDRSCLVPHDDESALVERVGLTKGGYETLWGCCGKTVEGDGDMGPPDGWCYEGKHTTDAKRARFRADSTIHDDKLTSCSKLRCFGVPPTSSSSASTRNTRKRPRASMREASDSEDGSEGEEDSGMEEMTGIKTEKVKTKGRKRSGSVRSRKSTASIKPVSKVKVIPLEPEDSSSQASSEAPVPAPKPQSQSRPRPKPKAKAPTTPKKPSSTVSVVVPSRASSVTPRSRTKRGGPLAKKFTEEVMDSEIDREKETEDEEEKPRKKRKVA